MFTVEVEFGFEASHFLPNVPDGHKCKTMHGHSYHVTIGVSAEMLRPDLDWVIDYSEIREAWQTIHELLDHATINDVKGLENSTCENLARWIYHHPTWERLSGDAWPSWVRVRETPRASCLYVPPSDAARGVRASLAGSVTTRK